MDRRLLVAGDETDRRRQLAEMLASQGYEVEVCRGEDIGDAVAATPPELLLLVLSPEAELSLLQRLKVAPGTREIPLVAVLADLSDAAAAGTLEAGADEFLLPPFNPVEVKARLNVLLKLKDDRQLLLNSQAEFIRMFQETGQALFICGRQGETCTVNPSLRRLLGHPGQRGAPVTVGIEALLYGDEDRRRFQEILISPPGLTDVKLNLVGKDGAPVTVLVNDLGLPGSSEHLGFQVQPVGSLSPLKKALSSLVTHLLPGARDYLALLHTIPLLGGRYAKIKKLGQGTFGEVWLVLDTEAVGARRHYVAKIPLLKAANSKFRKEAAICQKLSPHPGMAAVIETLEDDGKLIVIQEYVEGQTLGDMLDRELPRPLVERLILQLIEVVAHAHANRIMHRDIKPNNIIIQPDGTLKLLDFGVAKMLGDKEISATMVGSRPFMAPEQIMGESERRSDIWAIGVLMYLLYTGELPFYSEVEKLLIDQILETEPTPPRDLNPEIPLPLQDIILKCLKKKLGERYPNAVALRDDLLRRFPHYGTQAGRWPWIH